MLWDHHDFEKAKREVIKDKVVTEDEVWKLVRVYDNVRYTHDSELKRWLNKHGYDIKLTGPHHITIQKIPLREKLNLPNLTPQEKQKIVWMSIVGPAAIASLFLL